MFSVSNLLAILASFIILFFGGYLYYGILAAGFYESHAGSATGIQKEQVDMTFIAIGCLFEAFVMTTLYSKWANGDYTVSNGFKFGAFLGLFVGFGIGLITYGTTNYSDLTGHIADGIFNIFFFGLTGIVIALVLNKTSKKEA
jgi:uncharacterized membrane protein (DUF485 family)